MTKESYLAVTGFIRENPRRIRFIQISNRLLTGFVFLAYPAFLLLLLLQKNSFFLRALSVPAVSFLAVSLFRRILNIPRPYERFGIPPVLSKDTQGKSFPSRHVFSVFIIATTVYVCFPFAGILLGIAGVLLGLIRIVGGVHTPLDVAAGALIGIGCGIAGYLL